MAHPPAIQGAAAAVVATLSKGAILSKGVTTLLEAITHLVDTLRADLATHSLAIILPQEATLSRALASMGPGSMAAISHLVLTGPL